MPKVGSLGLDMMFRTCTVQVRYKHNYKKAIFSKSDQLFKHLSDPSFRLI